MRPLSYFDDDYLLSDKLHAFDDLMLPGEEMVQVAAISPGIYWRGIAMVCAAVFAAFYGFALAVYLMMVAGILFLTALATKKYLMLAATSQRVIIGGGFFNQEVIYLPYSKIEMVEVVRSPFGMLFGYATVILSGTGRMRLIVPFVEDANVLADEISGRVYAASTR